ncbi:MAG TPA: hypothetical protein DDW20_02230 [Firmicutes bacterium]|nr:hypothetical protein [Bacillota bacterium]
MKRKIIKRAKKQIVLKTMKNEAFLMKKNDESNSYSINEEKTNDNNNNPTMSSKRTSTDSNSKKNDKKRTKHNEEVQTFGALFSDTGKELKESFKDLGKEFTNMFKK